MRLPTRFADGEALICCQISIILNTVFRRTFKVIVTLIACYFIWSVSQASIDGWGIRLPQTLKKWHRQADRTDLIKATGVSSEIYAPPFASILICQILCLLLADLCGQPNVRC